MPELYAGLRREPTSFPVQSPGATVPQAWAAGSAFLFLQAILGLQPNAAEERLYVDPVLPDWLPDITLADLRIGKLRFDIRFRREGEVTRWDVLGGDEPSRVVGRSFRTDRYLHPNEQRPSRSG